MQKGQHNTVVGRNAGPADMLNIPVIFKIFYIPGGWPDFFPST